jgi:hypothetical protein
MSRLLSFAGCALACSLCVVTPVHAQPAHGGLAGLLSNLILRDVVTPSNEGGAPGSVLPHDAHFSPFNRLYLGQLAAEQGVPEIATVATFNRALATELATFPLGSSSGGFVYTFEPTTGGFTRESASFGPAFAERSRTIGARRMNLGFSYRYSSYDTFEGRDLRDGEIAFYLPHNDCCPGQTPDGAAVGDGQLGPGPASVGFEGDLVQVSLDLEARTHTAAFFLAYGLTNRWDVGLAVPLVRVELDARAHADILRLSTADRPLVHSFEIGNPHATSTQVAASGSATGLGDILLRSKYNFVQAQTAGLAGTVDLRLPTGDPDDLLGAGAFQARVALVGSTGWYRFAQHFTVGYTFSGKGDLAPLLGAGADFVTSAYGPGARAVNDEFNFVAGAEWVAHPRLTIVGDLLGRSLRDAGRVTLVSKSFPYVVQGQTGPVQTARFDEFAWRPGHLNLLTGTLGFKANVMDYLLLSGHVLAPLSDAGLRDRVSFVVGLDLSLP